MEKYSEQPNTTSIESERAEKIQKLEATVQTLVEKKQELEKKLDSSSLSSEEKSALNTELFEIDTQITDTNVELITLGAYNETE